MPRTAHRLRPVSTHPQSAAIRESHTSRLRAAALTTAAPCRGARKTAGTGPQAPRGREGPKARRDPETRPSLRSLLAYEYRARHAKCRDECIAFVGEHELAVAL